MIIGHNFGYDGFNVKYDTVYSCDESGCDDEGVCRCGQIYNQEIEIERVDVSRVSEIIYELYFDSGISTKRNNIINSVLYGVTDEIDKYVIDRVLRINKIWNPNSWKVELTGGYYGQEIGDIIFNESVGIKIEKEIYEALSIFNLSERIEYLLNLEYDKILPELSGSSYELITVDRDSIYFGSYNHFKNVIKEDLDYYSDKRYRGIRGIVIKDGDRYRLIDGYHRCSKSENKKVKVLIAKKT